ncbi:hypothetical protein P3S68_015430 [Capsicum galapagoense]
MESVVTRGQELWVKVSLFLNLDTLVLILASSRRVNTGIMSSAHVTGDIGYQPTKELKWKNLCAVTQRQLQVQTRSKATGIRTRAQLLGKSPTTTKSIKEKTSSKKNAKGKGKNSADGGC